MLAAAYSRDLVTPRRRAPQRSRHDWEIPQSDQALARSRDLVTHAACGACRGRIRDGRRARPARERRARGRGSTRRSQGGPAKQLDWRPCSRACSRRPSNTVDAHGCDGQDRKRARNTSTCAVRVAPWPAPRLGRADQPHRPRTPPPAQSEEDGNQPRRRRVRDADRKKTEGEEDACSRCPKKSRFGSPPTASTRWTR